MFADAQHNLEALARNAYPGRGIVVGMDETARSLLQVYWIMGRSANSRNRVFKSEGGKLWTEPADPAKLADPSNIIYNAMRELKGLYVASNGDQTDTVIQAFQTGSTPGRALGARTYEPDAPHFTPRIVGLCSLRRGTPMAVLAVLKRSALGDGCDRHFFRYDWFARGIGHCITTYMGEGDPLPSFRGEPVLLPLPGKAGDVAQLLWSALNAENRVSLAVKSIDIEGGRSTITVINQYEQVR